MKTVKRIAAVVLLICFMAMVGYLFFTGSRLSSITDKEGSYEEL